MSARFRRSAYLTRTGARSWSPGSSTTQATTISPHPDVCEVSAIGVPDPDWGEIVVACVVLEPGAVADDVRLDAHCLASIARFKRPKRYVYLEALPKNNYGKVLKTELRVMMGK